MAVHWVNYDLNRAGQNYPGLIEYLKSGDSWCKPLKSSFLVKTSASVATLRDGIQKHIDANDDVLVINVDGKSWASLGLSDEINTWLSTNI